VWFGGDENKKKPAASTSMIKMKVGMYCQVLVHIHQNAWRLILENSDSNNQR
jgi:hypothetical protein